VFRAYRRSHRYRLYHLFWPGILAWVVVGVLFVTEGDRLAKLIGVVILAAWATAVVRVYRRRQD